MLSVRHLQHKWRNVNIRQMFLVLSLALAGCLGLGYRGNRPLVESRGHLVDVVEGEEREDQAG